MQVRGPGCSSSYLRRLGAFQSPFPDGQNVTVIVCDAHWTDTRWPTRLVSHGHGRPCHAPRPLLFFFSRLVIGCRRQHTTDAYHLRAAACLAYCLLGGRPKDDMIKKSPPSDPLTKNKGNDDALDGLKVSTSGSSMPNSLRHPCGGIQAFRFDNTHVLCAVRTLKCNRDL